MAPHQEREICHQISYIENVKKCMYSIRRNDASLNNASV